MKVRTAWTVLGALGSALAVAGLANTVRNLRVMHSPPPRPLPTGVSVPSAPKPTISVLLPLRNEEHRAAACLASLAALDCDEIVVLDDNSTDATVALVESVLGGDPRVRLLRGDTEPPPGWLGKPWACQRLADEAHGDVLVFVDADVVLAPDAAVAGVQMLDEAGLSVVCPYPRQLTSGALGRLVQPLLQWSWLTTLPLDVAERSPRASTAAGNGQFLVVDAEAYRSAGGHGAVRDEVLEDVALVRAIKANGGHGGMADGTELASCRMYADDSELVLGYTKSLWAAFGSPAGAAGVLAGLALAYLVPPLAMVIGPGVAVRVIGTVGYGAAVAGRVLVARRTAQHVFPDSWAHPASIIAFGWLVKSSFRRRRAGQLRWSGRPVEVAGGSVAIRTGTDPLTSAEDPTADGPLSDSAQAGA